jgi:hypothetical protein
MITKGFVVLKERWRKKNSVLCAEILTASAQRKSNSQLEGQSVKL